MKIADFCKTAAGGTPLKSNKSFYENGDIPWLLSGEVGKKNIVETKNFITQAGLDGSSAKVFPVNTVLIAMYGATAGEVGILRCEAATNQAVCGIYPNNKVLPEYLYYFFLDHKEQLVAQAVGNAQPNISQQKIKNTEINLPPIPEQKRLVAILDEAFADIEQARAKTEQNLKNARELFESYLQQVFSQRDEEWEELTVGQATGGVFTGPFGSLLHKSDYIENGTPLVNPAHITATGIEPDLRKTISNETAQRLSSYIMNEGDIVIGRRGEMGRCALITSKESGYLCGTGSFFIKASERVLSDYLVRYLRSSVGKSRLEQMAGGAVMLNLSNAELSNLSLYFPPIDKQKESVREIGNIAVQIEAVEQIYQNKLTALDELKQSILQKAFSGELTKKSSLEVAYG